MTHISENSHPLRVRQIAVQSREELLAASKGLTDVCIVRLPACNTASEYNRPLNSVGELVARVDDNLGPSATLVVLGEVIDLVQVQAQMPASVRYQHWIAVNRTTSQIIDKRQLPHQHFGALVYTRYTPSLRHTKTRIKYTYCPVCDKTTKDYGGKKHTYHEAGTLISDVWRDISCDLGGDISPVVDRFADLFGLEPHKELTVFDCRPLNLQRLPAQLMHVEFEEEKLPDDLTDHILNGDCLEELRRIPSNSIDFVFTDPPYNLGKKYLGYTDDLEIQDYFKWCDEWIGELTRILKPGRTLALLNIPLWAVRHFLYMQTVLKFQNWIAWDALAFPVRLIMPAHYTILCFSKGESRELPGLTGESKHIRVSSAPKTFNALEPLADGYCLRADCVDTRIATRINDRTPLTDLWGDIHRLKHNSRRVDHPCQLPPHLMYRLISIFTRPGESILDCFNGAGTTTLTAHQLGRKYVGVDSSEKYCKMAEERHLEILNGLDPFRKEERVLTSKNSPVPRLAKQVYKVPKKTLQLEVRRVAKQIGHIPSRDELIKYGKYSIEYYDKYFVSWGEVTAAARTTGMTEKRANGNGDRAQPAEEQLQLLERRASYRRNRRD
ncbi:MAG: site-specific DNA-methyltransferase [Chloroflexi bacterium]|nr:site-specific DNA-methyltransferase [Chloroflexota bacterium]